MALPKASIGNSASFQISGTPFVYTATANKIIDFKYVTRAITVQSDGVGNKITFDGGISEMTLVQNKVYKLEVKCKQLKIIWAAGTVSVVAELTNVEARQASIVNQYNSIALYHFNDSVADAIGSSHGIARNLDPYVSSGAGGTGASGFDKAAVFSGNGQWGSVGSNTSYVELSDLYIGTSDFTIEFWMNATPHNNEGNHTIICSGGATNYGGGGNSSGGGASDVYGDWSLNLIDSGAGNRYWRVTDMGDPPSTSFNLAYWQNDWSLGWQHVAIVRKSLGNGNSQYRMFFNGVELAADASQGNGSPKGVWSTSALGGAGTPWFIGTRLGARDSYASVSDWRYKGELDELLISKSVKYDSDFTPLNIPYILG